MIETMSASEAAGSYHPEQDEDCIGLALDVRGLLGTRLRQFDITVTDKGIELRGSVDCFYAKQLVQHAVMKLTRIRIAANEIQVDRDERMFLRKERVS